MSTENDIGPIKSVTTVAFKNNPDNPNDRMVLLVQNGADSGHPTGIYGLPAGKVDPDESWETAAARELLEESGLVAKQLIKLPTFYEAILERKNGGKQPFCCWSFYCSEYSGELRGANGETEPVWIPLSQVEKLPLIINVLAMIIEATKVDPAGIEPATSQCE